MRPIRPARRLLPLWLGLVLAVAAGVAPAIVPTLPLPAPLVPPVVRAADDIDITTAARYTVQPAAGRVRVVISITAVNRKPNQVAGGGVTRYFYDGVNLGVQPEARGFRATESGEPTQVSAADRDGYRLVTVRFLEPIYLGDTARVRLVFNLPGGAPRSTSDVRVGPAFATFTAWAFGDRGSVRIEVPSDFRVDIAGDSLVAEPGRDGLQTWSGTAADPLDWYAWISATNEAGLTSERLSLPAGEQVVIRSWPDDPRWRDRVRTLLDDGLPGLTGRIGLPWPVDGILQVSEVHTPLLEGYAGFYNPATDEITISEDLDDLTIVHEASHAWFNGSLFQERWITEGLADEYASLVLQATGRGRPGPDKVSRSAPEAFPLEDWPPPAAIRDEAAAAAERYGYAAAWTLVRRIVTRVGEPGMRAVFAAAAAGTTAYPGEGIPEPSRLPNDWRRFLDLAQQAADPATLAAGSRTLAELVAQWALDPQQAAELPARETALAAYGRLQDHGGTWAPPGAVRTNLDRWRFEVATAAIDRAETALEIRDEIADLATGASLVPDPSLEASYQDAGSVAELNVMIETATRSLDVLGEVVAARDAAGAPRDWITELGLDGMDPAAGATEAGRAWETGDLDTADTTAIAVVDALAAAPEAGRNRALLVGGGGLLVTLVLLVSVALGVHRRRRPTRAQSSPPVPHPFPDGAWPYATLPPDGPAAEPPGELPSADAGADPT
jgi:hypothetical protein